MDEENPFCGEHKLMWNSQQVAVVDGLCIDLFPIVSATLVPGTVTTDMHRLLQHIVNGDWKDPTFDQQLLENWQLIGPHREGLWGPPFEIDFGTGAIEFVLDFT